MTSKLISKLWIAASCIVWAQTAWAATYTVTNGNDSGAGSLRQAILDANASGGADEIVFSTSNSIYALSDYSITGPVLISGTGNTVLASSTASNLFSFSAGSNGSTLTGLAICKANIGVRLNASCIIVRNCRIGTDWTDASGQGNAVGIYLYGSYNYLNNNVISGNTGYGISSNTTGTIAGNVIQGNLIGTNSSGTAAIAGQLYGIYLNAAAATLIGGDSLAGEGNLISGNSANGIQLQTSSAMGTTICGNIIGLSLDQTAAFATNNGIGLRQSSGNWIGLPQPGYGNVIAGYSNLGISFSEASGVRPQRNTIQNNIIGLNASGTDFAGLTGINGNSMDYTLIGGVVENLEGNVISGHGSGNGILIDGYNNTVSGNYIGTDLTGTSARANNTGIYLNGNGNILGGANAAGAQRGNVVSGNSGIGINCYSGAGNIISGNNVGVNASGGTLANGGYGINVGTNAVQNLIGGVNPNEGNVVAGNGNYGIFNMGSQNRLVYNRVGLAPNGNTVIHNTNGGIMLNGAAANLLTGNLSADTLLLSGAACSGNTLTGNLIGVRANGSAVAGLDDGVQIFSSAHDNWVGLPGGNGNLIAHCQYIGITVDGAAALGNALLGNTISAFGSAGIFLDNGGNAELTYPTIYQAYAGAEILGTAGPNNTVEVFRAESRSGAGGSLEYLGTTAADSLGQWSLAAVYNNGDYITALATDSDMNTSTFAANYRAAIPTPTPTITMTQTVTRTSTRTPTRTATATPSATRTQTPTCTISQTCTITPTSTSSPIVSPTATATITPTQPALPTASATVTLTVTRATAVSGAVRAYPNPGRGQITFALNLERPAQVTINLYNLNGERAASLTADADAGGVFLTWDCRNAAPGVYMARILTDGAEKAKLKVAVLKK